jgi:hypothetical protein
MQVDRGCNCQPRDLAFKKEVARCIFLFSKSDDQ